MRSSAFCPPACSLRLQEEGSVSLAPKGLNHLHCLQNISGGDLDARQVDTPRLANFLLDILCLDVDRTRNVFHDCLHPRHVDRHAFDRLIIDTVRDWTDRLDTLQRLSYEARDEARGCRGGCAGSDADSWKSDSSSVNEAYKGKACEHAFEELCTSTDLSCCSRR